MALLTGMLPAPEKVSGVRSAIGMIGLGLVLLGFATMLVSGAAGAVHVLWFLRKKGKMP